MYPDPAMKGIENTTLKLDSYERDWRSAMKSSVNQTSCRQLVLDTNQQMFRSRCWQPGSVSFGTCVDLIHLRLSF